MSFEDREGQTRPIYSEVMEDYDVVASAVAPQPGEVAVIVASAGDNVFHAMLDGAREVHGVDSSAAQTALCRLKTSAVERLTWRELAELIGTLAASPERRAEFLTRLPGAEVSAVLGEPAAREVALAHGLAACGELVAFVAPLREGLTARVGEGPLREILTDPDPERRQELWTRHFETGAVEDFLALALNRDTISDALLPRAAFDQETDVPFHVFYFSVLRHLIVQLDPCENPFLHRLWLGSFPSAQAVPPYLQEASHELLRERAGAIQWHTQGLAEFLAERPAGSVDIFNLSNIGDWMDESSFRALWRELDRTAAPGARAFLRSFLVNRPLPSVSANTWSTDPNQNLGYTRADRVGYFARCEVWTRAGS